MIDINTIISVYSGKPGCACGCRGKHTTAKAYQNLRSKNRGYEVTDDECNDRTVSLIVNKMNKQFDECIKGDNNYSLELPNRLYIAYFA